MSVQTDSKFAKFDSGFIVSKPSFVVDCDGFGWWINPDLMEIWPAVFEIPEVKPLEKAGG